MKETDTLSKRELEKKTVGGMIVRFCKKKHGQKGAPCASCRELIAYTAAQSDLCPYMETKTFCSNCKTPCYRPDMRERIREVMRYSGPRMIFYDPVMAVKYLKEKNKEKSPHK